MLSSSSSTVFPVLKPPLASGEVSSPKEKLKSADQEEKKEEKQAIEIKHEQKKSIESAKEGENKDLSPTYTAKTITLLLKAYGIDCLKTELLKDEKGQFDLYVYPSQTLTPQLLLKDNIDYFLVRGLAAGDRRVAFLLPTTAGCTAFIVQLSEFDKSQGVALHALLKNQGLDNTDKILAKPEIVASFKPLYRKIHCLFLGANANPTLIGQLRTPIQLAYANRIQLDFMAMEVHNPSVVLLEHILSMLRQGITRPVNTLAVALKHREQITSVLRQSLVSMETTQKALYAQVITSFTILFKYMALAQSRVKRHEVAGDDLAALEQLLVRDQQVKIAIFQGTVNIEAGLKSLDLKPLLQMFEQADKPEALAAQLKQACKLSLRTNATWLAEIKAQQSTLNKHWLLYLRHQGKKASQFCYQHSLAGIGGELLSWLGKPLLKSRTLRAWGEPLEDSIQSGVKFAVLCATLSPALARRSQAAAGQWLKQVNAPLVLKAVGAGAGLAYTYAAGVYGFVRHMGVLTVALKASERLTRPTLDEEQAQVIPRAHRRVRWGDATVVMRAVSLTITLIETAYEQDYQPLIRAIGGMSGSIGVTALTTRLLPELRPVPGQPVNEDQALSLFLVSMAGYDLGQAVTQLGLSVWLTLQAKQAILARLLTYLQSSAGQAQFPDARMELSALATPPWRWFNTDNPVRLEWRNPRQGFFYQADCQAYSEPPSGDKLVCKPPVIMPPRLEW